MSKRFIQTFWVVLNGLIAACLIFNALSPELAVAAQVATATLTPTRTLTPIATQSGTNVAQGKSASQSSTLTDKQAGYAVDGNTDGTFANNSVSSTQMEAHAWWQVDLGANYNLTDVRIWNRTDAGTESRLSNFYVLVSDVPFTSTDLTTARNQAGVGSYLISGTGGRPSIVNANRSGRYVRVQLVGTEFLSLAEVEVYATGQSSTPLATATPTLTPTLTATSGSAPVNIALGKSASQSSTYYESFAYLSVDGDTNGVKDHGSVSHTNNDYQAWWQVDLGAIYSLADVKVWNRTDAATDRLNNFYVLVSNVPFVSNDLYAAKNQTGVSNYYISGNAGTPTIINVNCSGRYVRVQLTATNYLNMAEVQVFSSGLAPAPTATSTPTATPTPASFGTYDDRSGSITYASGWVRWTGNGPYNNTFTYSNTVGKTVSFIFSGQSISVIYLAQNNNGVMRISIDGGTPVNVSQHTTSDQWQSRWDSPTLSAGTHTIQIIHDSGTTINIDAFIVGGPPPTSTMTSTQTPTSTPIGIGTYDDRSGLITYASGWVLWMGNGPYNNTFTYSNTVGKSTSFVFNGQSISVIYLAQQSGGVMTISIDGETPVFVSQYATSDQWQSRWDSPILSAGTHTIQITHNSGATINIDDFIVGGTPPTSTITPIFTATPTPAGLGTYDDRSGAIIYSSGWARWTGNGPYNNTFTYSNLVSNSVSFIFNGQSISVIYLAQNSGGVMRISIDGGTPVNINQHTTSDQWQSRWDSPTLSTGTHTIQITHDSGTTINIDAFIVGGTPPTSTMTPTPTATATPVGVGTYDDRSGSITYISGWTRWTGDGPYNNTFTYSNTVGKSASFIFSGQSISVIYLAQNSGGVMGISIDGGTPVSVSQYTANDQWQSRWDSPTLFAGTHTIQITHDSGATVNIDAFIVEGAPPTSTMTSTPTPTSTPAGVGTYDDRSGSINYISGWILWTGNGPYSNTFTYSNTIGNSASFTFNGQSISLVYLAQNSGGVMAISIDGGTPVSVSQQATSDQWQSRWNSPSLSTGTHMIQITHSSGATINIDDFEVR